MSYLLTVADRAGVFQERNFATFGEVLAATQEARAKWPRKLVMVCNVDQCDVDSDGLTDDEREAVS